MKKHLVFFAATAALIIGCTTNTVSTSPSSSATPASMSSSAAPMDLGVQSVDYTKPADPTQAEIQTASVPARDSAERLKDGTLYSRLGGIKNIRPVVHQIALNAVGDTRISRFFTALSPARLTNLEQRVVEQVCEATGGPCVYTGESMPETHRTLNISAAEFDAFIEDAAAALDKFQVPATEKGQLAAALISMKDMVINK